jgi:hypothetical protein
MNQPVGAIHELPLGRLNRRETTAIVFVLQQKSFVFSSPLSQSWDRGWGEDWKLLFCQTKPSDATHA